MSFDFCMMFCDLDNGPVTVTGNSLECNNESYESYDPPLIITGHSTLYGIRVTDFHSEIRLSSVSLTTTDPLTVISSSVSIVLDGDNVLESVDSDRPAVSCASHSNITFSAYQEGRLSATGNSTGIGSPSSGACGTLTFLNGSFVSRGHFGPGIGSGRSPSTLDHIVFVTANVTAHSESYGAGIGSGSGASAVNSIEIRGGTIDATASLFGAAIGAGNESDVEVVTITGGDVTVLASYGSGIGAGSGKSTVKRRMIDRGSVKAPGSGQATAMIQGSTRL
jgi:hypothetical protein